MHLAGFEHVIPTNTATGIDLISQLVSFNQSGQQ